VVEFSTRFEKDFSLLVCISCTKTSTSMWYIDNESSHHMKGIREHFSKLTEIEDLEVVPGDDSVVKEVGSGRLSFQRESHPLFLVRDVLYVLDLKKILILVSTIENKGYELVFHDGRVLMYPKGSNITLVKVIGIGHGKLYMFLFQLA
jgi:hypothetical protein